MQVEAIHSLAKSLGFARTYIIDASMAADVQEGIHTLLLMMYPYGAWEKTAAGCPRISAYYFAAQEAFVKAGEMVKRLKEAGEDAALCDDVRLMPIFLRLADFAQGRNMLHYHKEFGSRFHVQTVGLVSHHPMAQEILRQGDAPDMCGTCTRCIKACPTKALALAGFERGSCLRQYMLKGAPVPENMRSLMGPRLLGCDTCQQVCPYNAFLEEDGGEKECFPLDSLLGRNGEVLSALADRIGRNMAIPNRICAQACLLAGNSKNPSYLPVLKELSAHPSPTIAQHAKWAVQKLTGESGSATD